MTQSDDAMAKRIAEFKNDPQKLEIANKFVDEVIAKARDEAVKRMKERKRLEGIAIESGVASNDTYPLCCYGKMNGDHLKSCDMLSDVQNDEIARYWEHGRRTAKIPTTGVG